MALMLLNREVGKVEVTMKPVNGFEDRFPDCELGALTTMPRMNK